MATIDEALGIALQYQEAGRFGEAEEVCQRILAVDPNHLAALRIRGEAALHLGRYAVAAESYERAVRLDPNLLDAYCNLGTALQSLGRLDEATACFQRAIEIQPDFASAHFNLGNLLRLRGQLPNAADCYRSTLKLDPRLGMAHVNLGLVLAEQGELDEAAGHYRAALDLEPDLALAHNGLGTVFQRQKKLVEAAACYRRAVQCDANFAEAHNNLGVALTAVGELEEAFNCLARAIELNPDSAEAHHNLGNLYGACCQPRSAIPCHRRALELAPNYAEALNSLGIAYTEIGQHDQAAECYTRALALKPDFSAAHVGQATLELLHGNFETGWTEYELRWKHLPVRHREQLEWMGQIEPKRAVLLHAEQGFGDIFQFIRYAPLVKQRVGMVYVECPKKLIPILRTCPGIDRLIAEGEALPRFDTHAALLSLPRILGTTLETIPSDLPYLFADASLVNQWQQRLEAIRGFRIGLNWRGRGGRGTHRWRDVPPECLRKVADVPGVQLISLQKGATQDELAAVGGDIPVFDPGANIDQDHGAFMDTAAIMMSLALVITSDTAVAHLAGALGVPVWLALPFAPDWRWLLDRPDSPWYRTMRLFRQKSLGDWTGTFEEMESELRKLVAAAP